MSEQNKVIKLTKEEVLKRAADLWYRYRDKIGNDMTYDEYIKEVLKEWEVQNVMGDERLKKRRRENYREIVNKVRTDFSEDNKKLDEKTKEQIIVPG